MKERTYVLALLAICLLCAAFVFAAENRKQPSADETRSFRVIQISDLHIGLRAHPESEAHARQAIELVNQLRPDLVLVSGDISENYPSARESARELLQGLHVPYKAVPGNHDVHDDDMSAYRAAFGKDFYSFEAGGIRFIGLNSQLMGNFDKFESPEPTRNAGKAAQESQEMFEWLASLPQSDKPTIVFQHIPITYDGAPDNKPYWGIADPYRTEEIKQLKRLHVKDIFAGHWHNPQTKTVEGIAVHIAPAVSYGIKTDQIGIMMHTIEPSGRVKSELIPLKVAQ